MIDTEKSRLEVMSKQEVVSFTEKDLSRAASTITKDTSGHTSVQGPPLLERYEIVKQIYKAEIGNTTVSVVRRRGKTSQEESTFILKEIDMSYLINPLYKEQTRNEFKMQSDLNHENIVRCLEFEETAGTVRALLEQVNRPEYLSIELDDNMDAISNQYMLKTFMIELLEAMSYIHSKNIVHCDIKVENILGKQLPDSSFPSLKICDFGLAQRLDPATKKVKILKKMGTKDYIAPEVKDDSFISYKVDIWSLGLVFYKMCTTYLPNQLNREWVKKGLKVPFREADWEIHPQSKELMDLIIRMLQIDPEFRISAQDALEHPYFNF